MAQTINSSLHKYTDATGVEHHLVMAHVSDVAYDTTNNQVLVRMTDGTVVTLVDRIGHVYDMLLHKLEILYRSELAIDKSV